MAGLELLSAEGLRQDGRKARELRKMEWRFGVLTQAHGSAYIEQGNTKVMASVYGPHEIRGSRGMALHDRAVVNCQYSMATFSTGERTRRPHGDRKSTEMAIRLKETFEAAILTQEYPRSQIDIYVQILQADGGNYSACVNAATLALIDGGIPMRDYVCACSVGFIEDTPLVDLSYIEEASGGPQLTMAILPKFDKIALLDTTSQLHEDLLKNVMDAASKACKDVYAVLDQAVKGHLQENIALLVDRGRSS